MKLLHAGASAGTWGRVNDKSGMGFEAGRYDLGDMRGDTLMPDRDRGHAFA